MIPVGILTAVATSSFSFLLDQFPSASYGYSIRKLRNGYTGNCVRIRRSSDNTETDIGFVNNTIDTSAISNFCGSGNGFVVIWYDQSGNGNNGTQFNSTKQGQIYFSGAFVLRGNKICIQYQSLKTLDIPEFLRTAAQNYSWWMTYEKNATGNTPVLLGGPGGYLWLDYGQTSQFINGSQTINITPNDYALNTRYLVNNICNVATVSIYSNGSLWGSRITTDTASINVFAFESGRAATLTIQEFIIYANSQAANRTGIDTNINSFFTIY
jgi:hypothetical protein